MLMTIVTYIGAHWTEWLFTACLALLGWAYKAMLTRMKEEQAKNAAIAEGVQSLLRESIVANYNKYSRKNACPIYAKESIKKVYKAYSELGGNDVATNLYNELLKMPAEPKEEKQNEN